MSGHSGGPVPAAGRAASPPLDGLVVLDFTHVLAGPFCTMILGDLGADVVKIEKPDGDETRRSAFRHNDYSVQFGLINRNKRSVTIDLSTEDGRAVAQRLARRADVVVENFRPGTMRRLGLGYDELRATNPGLVYCSITGFGASGRSSGRGGFDIVAQGESGLMSVTGTREGELVKIGVPVCDLTAAANAAVAVCAALYRRHLTGEGDRIDVALVDAGMSLLVWEAAQLWSYRTVPGPMGTSHRNRAPYQAFRAADGAFIVGAGNEATWRALCRALEREDLAADPRFVDNQRRMRHEVELVEELAKVFAEHGVEHWLRVLADAGCPCGRIADLEQAFASPVAVDRSMRLEMPHPNGGVMYGIGFPYKLSAAPAQVRRRPPHLGEHCDEVLAQLGGYSPADVAALRESGVVG